MDYLKVRELYHHGIKGQKWGVRRYQYEDGSLTEEGRKRYNTGAWDDDKKSEKELIKEGKIYTKADGKHYYKDADGKEKRYKVNINQLDNNEMQDYIKRIASENTIDKFEADKQNRDKEARINKATQPAKDAKDILDSSANVLNATAKALPTGNGKYVKKNYSGLSDQELRTRISRLQLEESYGRLTGDTKYVKSGSEKAREILQTAGAIVGIAGSAAALTATILKIKADKAAAHSDQDDNVLMHHGIKGQKWGIRRYQNEDGSLTPEGQSRYGGKTHYDQLDDEERADLRNQLEKEEKQAKTSRNVKIAAGVITATAVAAGAAYVASKYSSNKKELTMMKNAEETRLAKNATSAAKRAATKAWNQEHGISGAKVVVNNNGMLQIGKIFNDIKLMKQHALAQSGIGDEGNMDYLDIHELYHHGVKGQKWGVRRYQDEDGSLTADGKRRYKTDLGTKEIIKNTTDYDKLVKSQKKKYIDYHKKAGAKKGFLVGMGVGAGLGVGKQALNMILNPNERAKSGNHIANSFVRKAITGAFGGSVIGTLVGAKSGQKKAEAKLAENGKEYVDNLLNTPLDRIRYN